MSAGSGVASPGDGDALGDDAEEDVPPVLPASPYASVAVTLPLPQVSQVLLARLPEHWKKHKEGCRTPKECAEVRAVDEARKMCEEVMLEHARINVADLP